MEVSLFQPGSLTVQQCVSCHSNAPLWMLCPFRYPLCLRRVGLSSQPFPRGRSYRLNVCWSDRWGVCVGVCGLVRACVRACMLVCVCVWQDMTETTVVWKKICFSWWWVAVGLVCQLTLLLKGNCAIFISHSDSLISLSLKVLEHIMKKVLEDVEKWERSSEFSERNCPHDCISKVIAEYLAKLTDWMTAFGCYSLSQIHQNNTRTSH